MWSFKFLQTGLSFLRRCFLQLIQPACLINNNILLICREGLGEGYDGDIAFASSFEMFGGGHNDPLSVAFGGYPMFALSFNFFHLKYLCLFHSVITPLQCLDIPVTFVL